MNSKTSRLQQALLLCRVLVLSLVLFCSVSQKSSAQITLPFNPVQQIDSQLRALFSPLWHPTPGPDFLFDMASHALDSFYFTDNNPDTIDRDKWYQIFHEMRNSAYDTTILPPHDSLFNAGLQFQSDSIVMNILAFNFLLFKDSAFSTTDYYDFDTINNTMTDKPGRELDPFHIRRVFAASPHYYYYAYSQVTYRVDPDFIFYDAPNDFNANGWTLQIDFGDGAGWQTFNPNVVTHYNANYTVTGKIYIQTRVLDMGMNVIMSSIAEAYISKAQNKIAPPDDHIYMAALTAGIWNPCEGSGEPMKKIVIYVEGYDPGDFTIAGNRTARKIYSDMIKDEGIAELRNFGYTFVVVDWKQSGRDIAANGMELVELLNELKCRQRTIVGYNGEEPIEEATNEQFVMIAESMGGLVARYALCFMEQYPNYNNSWCLKEKMHNTRLLITFDSPHKGANIPLAYQILYRNAGSFLLGSNSITQAITGGLSNILLDATSVKQMLLYHVNAYNPITGNCSEDVAKTAFDATLAGLGNYPQYCKMMAMSNGSMAGQGQPVEWDISTQRTPNDFFLNFNSDSWVRVFGVDYLVMHNDFELRSSPNGSGTVHSASIQLYLPVIKISFSIKKRCPVRRSWLCPFPVPYVPDPKFRIWVDMVPVPPINVNYNVNNMEPYDVIPGSYESQGSDLVTNSDGDGLFTSSIARGLLFGFQTPDYDPVAHTWTTQGGFSVLGFGGSKRNTVYTDGLNFCYIPLFSALDYNLGSNTYWHNIETENITTKTNANPFHIITGIPNIYVNGNFSHLYVRNDVLGSWNALNYYNENDHSAIYHTYEDCDDVEGGFIRMLNREIGDDSIYIENRVANWTCIYDVVDYMGVNERSPYYEYPSSSGPKRIRAVYSKDDDYVINNGTTIFMASDTPDIHVPSGLPGSWYKDFIGWARCCTNYEGQDFKIPENPYFHNRIDNNNGVVPIEGKKPFNSIKDNGIATTGMLLYPNPANNSLHIRFKFEQSTGKEKRILMHDALGRMIANMQVEEGSGILTLQVDNFSEGIYIVRMEENGVVINAQQVSITH